MFCIGHNTCNRIIPPCLQISWKSFHQHEELVYPKLMDIPDKITNYVAGKFLQPMHFYDKCLFRRNTF